MMHKWFSWLRYSQESWCRQMHGFAYRPRFVPSSHRCSHRCIPRPRLRFVLYLLTRPSQMEGPEDGEGFEETCEGTAASKAAMDGDEIEPFETGFLHPPGSMLRYFRLNYLRGHHQFVYEHPNGLFIVGIAPEHRLMKHCRPQSGVSLVKIEFVVFASGGGEGGQKLGKVSGKRKKGGVHVKATQLLARITCSDSTTYDVYSGMTGQLIEVNERVQSAPDLVLQKAETAGYLAIIQSPRHKPPDRSSLITPAAYQSWLQEDYQTPR